MLPFRPILASLLKAKKTTHPKIIEQVFYVFWDLEGRNKAEINSGAKSLLSSTHSSIKK